MSFWDVFRKNPVDKIKVRELQGEEIRLKNQIERARKEINKLEKEKKVRFQEGVGADLLKKKMLAQEIKQLDMEVKLQDAEVHGDAQAVHVHIKPHRDQAVRERAEEHAILG
ncbi:MAG: hypothetical protein RQM90_15185 [Methanoculleus sp.]